jgi:hypothetical protein
MLGRGDASHFAVGYGEARAKFLAAAAGRGARLAAEILPGHRGVEDEVLAMDIARLGDPDAAAVLLLLSGTHGIEGYCGSGIQAALLRDDAFMVECVASGVALLFVHAVNPYGFSHGRRCNEDNVDLNRNFHDFNRPLPVNAAYAEIHPWLLPPEWPPTRDVEAALAAFGARHGAAALQAAATAGQYAFADGLFYGGTAPAWSNRALRAVLRRECAGARRIGLIDLHTGLGPAGHGEKIFASRNDPATLERARRWWGPQVTSFYDGSSASAALTGVLFEAVYDECPAADYTGIALEFGTLPLAQMLEALRADGWVHNHPEAPARLVAATRQRMRAAFYVEEDGWKNAVASQARDAVREAIRGMR